jgi:putative oxygen-independent coproporphyrinogen III oxidase
VATAEFSARPPAALYVHLPFCLSVCPYCDFVVYAGRAARGPTSFVDATVAALTNEIRLRAPSQPRVLDSVYFGGGTPSLLAPAQVAALLAAIDRHFGVIGDAEITLEANPGATDRGDLAGFRAAGVNRVSIGAQSMNEAELRRLGRRHSPTDVAETVTLARRAGFANISLDLLYDIPAQTADSWRRSLADALALTPDHLSAYALTLDAEHTDADALPISRGAAHWRDRARTEQDEDRAAEMYTIADEVLSAAGFSWYEISNWARPGLESRHNLAYWTGAAYEAVGPGAHAFDGGVTRRWNAGRLDTYISALSAGHLPPGGVERALPEERTILALRTRPGIAAREVPPPVTDFALANGLLEQVGGRVRLTLKGRLLSNELFARLLPDKSAAVA